MKYIKISSVLCLISLVCAALIALVNMVTSDTIKKNSEKTQNDTIKAIFENYDSSKSADLTKDVEDSAISFKMNVKDSSENALGTIYTVSGKNAYGNITIMVAIKEGKVYQVEFLDNGQSFSANVNDWVKTTFNSSKENVKQPWSFEGSAASGEHDTAKEYDQAAAAALDASCGATFGANLVKDLINKALTDYNKVVA